MNELDSIIFDLDGTLWDTCSACASVWNRILDRNGIQFRTILADDIRRVTGKPHEECIREIFLGLTEKQIQILVAETTLEDNLVVETLGGEIYSNVSSGLRRLYKNHRLFIVSNCQAGYIEAFLKFSRFSDLFSDYECWGNTRAPKAKNLSDVIKRNSLEHSVMVGDTESDRTAAQACGIPFLHVTYGFGTVASANLAFDTFEELTQHLLLERKIAKSRRWREREIPR